MINIGDKVDPGKGYYRQNGMYPSYFNYCSGSWSQRSKPGPTETISLSCNIMQEPAMGANAEYRSHEFRNVPGGFADWYGIQFKYAYAFYAFGVNHRLPSTSYIVDYKSSGGTSDTENWSNYYNGDILIKANPTPPFNDWFEREEKKFSFSWESEPTAVHGVYTCAQQGCPYNSRFSEVNENNGQSGAFCKRFKELSTGKWKEECSDGFQSYRFTNKTSTHYCYCYWDFSSYPNYRSQGSALKYTYYEDPERKRFPGVGSSFRFRTEGTGPTMGGYQWFWFKDTHVFTIPHRYVSLRSLVFIDGIPLCLVDSRPRDGKERRRVLAMKCNDAVYILDGREVWYIDADPTIKTASGELLSISDLGNKTYPEVGEAKGDKSVMLYDNDSSLKSFSVGKCLIAEEKKELKYHCDNEVESSDSSPLRPSINENGCNPLFDEPYVLNFASGSEEPYVVYDLKHKFGYLHSVKVKFTGKTSYSRIECYNDFTNKFNKVGIYTGEEIEAIISTDYCTKLKIQILNYENKCGDDKCIGIEKLELKSGMYEVSYQECTPDAKTGPQKWYMEPANNDFAAFNTTLQEFNEIRSDYLADISQLKSTLGETKAEKKKFDSTTKFNEYGDKLMAYETCESDCQALKKIQKKENWKSLTIGLVGQQSLLVVPPGGSVKEMNISDSPLIPAESCSMMKDLGKTKNGFYWIQPWCSEKPSLMYCILNGLHTMGLSIENSTNNKYLNLVTALNIGNNPMLFTKSCMERGLILARIEYVEDIKTIYLLNLLKQHANHEQYSIVIGADYGCSRSKCTGEYYSLDDSVSLNPLATAFNQWIGSEFIPISGNPLMVINKGKIITVKFNDVLVNSVPCMTQDEMRAIPLNCDHTFEKVTDVLTKVICTEDCTNKGPTFGNAFYSKRSKMCQAMLHSQQFTKYGQDKFVSYVHSSGIQKSFVGSKNGLILSVDQFEESMAYSFTKEYSSCPVDMIKDLEKGSASFIQNKLQLRTENKFTNKLKLKSKLKSKDSLNDQELLLRLEKQKADKDYEILMLKKQLANQSDQSLENSNSRDIDISDNQQQNENIGTDNNQEINENTEDNYRNIEEQIPQYNRKFSRNQQYNRLASNNNKYYNVNNQINTIDQKYISDRHEEVLNNHDYDQLVNSRYDDNSKNLNLNYRSLKSQRINSIKKNHKLKRNDHSYEFNRNEGLKIDHFNKKTNTYQKVKYDKVNLKPDYKFMEIKHANMYLDEFSQQEKENYDTAHEQYLKEYNLMIKLNEKSIRSKKQEITLEKLMSKFKDISTYNNYINKKFNTEIKDQVIDYEKYFKENDQTDKIRFQEDQEIEEQNRFKQNGTEPDNDPNDLDDSKKDSDKKDIVEKEEKKKKYKHVDNEGNKMTFGSDEMAFAEKYYLPYGKTLTENFNLKFYAGEGDGTSTNTTTKDIEIEEMVNIGYQFSNLFNQVKKNIENKVQTDGTNLKISEGLVTSVVKSYDKLDLLVKTTQGMITYQTKYFKELRDKIRDMIETMFQYVSMSYHEEDLPGGDEKKLPMYFNLESTFPSVDVLNDIKFNITDAEVFDISQQPKEEQKDGMGMILTTKYHRTYDGSFHLSVKLHKALAPLKVENKKLSEPLLGVFFRYSDKLTHYVIKFNFHTKTIQLVRNFPTESRVMGEYVNQKMFYNDWMRIVVKFIEYKVQVWIHQEGAEVHLADLDDHKRAMEFNIEEVGQPFRFYDPELKSGRVGLYCSNCVQLEIRGLQLWADTCKIKAKKMFDNFQSKLTVRYREDYKSSLKRKLITVKNEMAVGSASFGFFDSEGRIKSIRNDKIAYMEDMQSIAAYVRYKDPLLTHDNFFDFDFSMKIKEGNNGTMCALFKYISDKDYFAYCLRFVTRKNKYYSMLMHKHGNRNDRIFKSQIPMSSMGSGWNVFKLRVIDNLVYVFLNNNSLIVDAVKVEEMMNKRGTIGFGINNCIAEFADVHMGLVSPDEFFYSNQTAKVTKKLSAKHSGISVDAVDSEGDSGESNDNDLHFGDLSEEMKEIGTMEAKGAVYTVCMETNTPFTKLKYCTEELALNDAKNCERNFCSICCLNLAGDKYDKCNIECKEATKMVSLQKEVIEQCMHQPNDYTKIEQLFGCDKCCESLKGDSVYESDILECKNNCKTSFDKVDYDTSYALDAEGDNDRKLDEEESNTV